jgi:hypothetical protein
LIHALDAKGDGIKSTRLVAFETTDAFQAVGGLVKGDSHGANGFAGPAMGTCVLVPMHGKEADPRGHMVRQKGRLVTTIQISRRIRMVILLKKIPPTNDLRSGRMNKRGIPASRVPAGQMYLQNQVDPNPNSSTTTRGRMITNKARMTYLIQVRGFHIPHVGEGILCMRS